MHAPTTRVTHRTLSRWCEKWDYGRTSRKIRYVSRTAGSLACLKGWHDRSEPDTCAAKLVRELEQHLGFYLTRFFRIASKVAQKQAKITPHKGRELNTKLELVDEAESMLTTRQRSVSEFRRLLPKSWKIQASSNSEITNTQHRRDLRRSAEFWRPEGKQQFVVTAGAASALRARLKKFRCVPFSFFRKGSDVVVYEQETPYDRALAQERSLIYA